MEHPLLEVDPNLSVDQLQTKINELTKKLTIAYRSGNLALISQLLMVIETFINRYREKIQEMYDSKKSSGSDFSDRIDIS
jgi:hypothetical protein